jgi:hypothetical protein
MAVQVPYRVHAEVLQEGVVWPDPAALGHYVPRACSAQECQIEEGHLLPDHVHMLIAECGTQGAECSGPQIPGEGYFVSTVGRTEENRPCHSRLDIGGPGGKAFWVAGARRCGSGGMRACAVAAAAGAGDCAAKAKFNLPCALFGDAASDTLGALTDLAYWESVAALHPARQH